MSSTRHLLGSVLSLLCLIGLAGGVAGWLHTRGPAIPPAAGEGTSVESLKKEEAEDEGVRFVGEVIRLEPKKLVERELSGGEGHHYELQLEADQFAHLVVEQKGSDVAVELHRPDGSGGRVDSPNWRLGREVVYTIAEKAGIYQVDVESSEPAGPVGRYEIRLDELRAATAEDRARLEAWRVFRKGEKLRKAGNLGEALAAYREALPLWRALGDPEWTAETQYRIGWMLQEQGRHAEALQALREAQPVLRGPEWRFEETVLLNCLGVSLLRLGQPDLAIHHHQDALVHAKEIGAPSLQASALNDLGNIYVNTGRAEEALDSFREALAVARAGGVPHEEASALLGQGLVLVFQGKPERALDSLGQALTLLESLDGTASNRAEALGQMAAVYQRLGRLEEARKHLDRALSANQETQDADRAVSLLNSLGTIHLRSGRLEEARRSYEQALGTARAAQNRYGEAFALLNLGRYHFEAGQLEQAFRSHEEAGEIFAELGHRRGEVSNLYGSARALHRLGRDAEAFERLQKVPAGVEALRVESMSPDSRTSYFATKQPYYELYIEVLMSLHRQQPDRQYDAAAMEIHERRRARSLLELLAESQGGIRRGVDPALLARERELLEGINRTEQRIQMQGGDTSQLRVQEELLSELERVRAEIRKTSSRYAALTQPDPLSFQGIQALLPDDETLLLIYSLGEEHSYLWAVGRKGRISRVLPTRSWIEDRASRVLADWSRVGRGARSDRWARELSEELLKPVAPYLGERRLAIVADGALQSLPFAALPDPRAPGEPLLARHEIVSLPSPSVLAVLRRELHDRLPAKGELAIVADPVFTPDDPRLAGAAGRKPQIPPVSQGNLTRALRDVGVANLERLPFTDSEARRITERFPASRTSIMLGFDASREKILNGELRKYRRLHFATHGLMSAQHPELSGLVLSLYNPDGSPREGFLLASEIYNLDLPADLVVLSACETGVGEDIRGEGILGLTRSFMYAGTPRIVVSLWKVSDRATAELMDRFYRGMIDHRLTPAQALRCAQLSMQRSEWSDPFLWAGFVFQGEWSRNIPAPPSPSGGGNVFQDRSIETPVVGTKVGGFSDDDLPPPGKGGPTLACPDLGNGRTAKTP